MNKMAANRSVGSLMNVELLSSHTMKDQKSPKVLFYFWWQGKQLGYYLLNCGKKTCLVYAFDVVPALTFGEEHAFEQ